MKVTRRSAHHHTALIKSVHPVLSRIYAARGITDLSQVDTTLQSLLPFHTLTDIDKATNRLLQALQTQQKILIVGDFDADGATSSALAVSALQAFGAQSVDFLVPNRFDYGYGLTPEIVTVAKTRQPDLIITVDNGIASIEGVSTANTFGIDVLITDHHLPGETLPKACAIVNPNQKNDAFPSKSIAGVGVIFYVMLALRRQLIEQGWFDKQGIEAPNMSQYLDLVALGTVADVVGLDQNNRIMVRQGLARIQKGRCRPGIQALIEIAGRKHTSLRESDLGFALAPRLNAAGRLDDMHLGVACLLAEERGHAKELAQQLDILNKQRRTIETEMKAQAAEALQALSLSGSPSQALPLGLCLLDASWHQGVIGILAGRLKEQHHRPVIIFAKVSDSELKGSARSIPGMNIRDVLAAIAKDHPGLISKFGGHAMAAGLSLSAENFEPFQKAFIKEVERHISFEQCQGVLLSDGELGPDELNLELAKDIQQAGPWGQQFPEPVFDGRFEILDQRIVGQNHLKLLLVPMESDNSIEAIAFNVDLKHWPSHRAKYLYGAYKLDINEYAGRTKLQLIMLSIEAQAIANNPVEMV